MCGIAGIIMSPGEAVDHDLLESMTQTLTHRGPDAHGARIHKNVGLGHRRLSITDTSEAANQPMSNEDDTVWVVFNGEIYNFPDLRNDLQRTGHTFRTRSDTEVIVHAWEEWGADCVDRFRGMFAFAIHDRASELLFLARDRLGKKPLYYTSSPGFFAFASEIKALRLLPAVGREIDVQALGEYAAYGNTLGARSIYRDVRRLEPAHKLFMNINRPSLAVEPSRYWSVRPEPDPVPTENEWLEEIDRVLSEAVRLRLISDVPLGAFLSGGIDSSLIVAYMVRHSTEPVRTFTVGFEEASHDESGYAERVARHLGTRRMEMTVRQDAIGVLDALVDAYDEPFADASAIPIWYLCRETREHVTVALSGDGGDESFCGYNRYPYSLWMDRVGRVLTPVGRLALARTAAGLSRTSRLRRPLKRLSRVGFQLYNHALGYTDSNIELLHPEIRSELQPEVEGKLISDDADLLSAALLDRYAHNDLRNYLPDDVLVKVDRASMAHSLEVRCPLLDQEVVELAARIPHRHKVAGLTGKRILRRLLARHLPKDLIERPKMGFGVPVGAWLHSDGPLASRLDTIVHDKDSPTWKYFDREEVGRRYSEHLLGGADLHVGLWRVMVFDRWARSNQKSVR
jgi:asparagine synthase (glutamine-hydrolysing)